MYDIRKSAIKHALVDIYLGDPEGIIQDPPIDELMIRKWICHLPTGNGYYAITTSAILTDMLGAITNQSSPLYQGKDFIITHDDLVDILADIATRLRLRIEKISRRRVEYKILDNFDVGFRFNG